MPEWLAPGPRAGPEPLGPDRRAEERAVALAYRAISSRERTEAEVRAFLARRGVEGGAAEAAVAELAWAGYLDDAGYAHRYAEDRRTLDGWGSERIARSLERRGVAAEHVAAALAPIGDAEEMEAALGLLARRMPRPPERDRDRARALRLLVTRGYGSELAYEAVRRHEAGSS